MQKSKSPVGSVKAQQKANRRPRADVKGSVEETPVPETDAEAFLRLISEKAIALPPKQRRFAEQLLNFPDEVVFGTLRSVAHWSGLSSLTILRFTKALGFDGFHTFQGAVRAAYLVRTEGGRPRSISQTSAVSATLEQQKNHLTDVAERIRPEELDALCEAIQGGRRVLICTAAPAADLGTMFARLLQYAGVRAETIPASGIDMMVGLSSVGKGDVVIGIHLSMLFSDVYQAIHLAHLKKATTIVIGGTPISPLAGVAAHFVYAHAKGKASPFSFVGLISLIEIIAARLIERRPAQAAISSKVLLDLELEERLIMPPSKKDGK